MAPAAGDIMVRAPVPIIVTAAINIAYKPGADVVSDAFIASLDTYICDAVNKVKLGTKVLSAAVVMPAVVSVLGDSGYVTEYPTFMGRLISPYGGNIILPKDIALRVPDTDVINQFNTSFFMPYGDYDTNGHYCPNNVYNFTPV